MVMTWLGLAAVAGTVLDVIEDTAFVEVEPDRDDTAAAPESDDAHLPSFRDGASGAILATAASSATPAGELLPGHLVLPPTTLVCLTDGTSRVMASARAPAPAFLLPLRI